MDNAATSFPKPAAVVDALVHYHTHLGASPGRGAYAESLETGRLMHVCRERIVKLIGGARPECVVFTLNCSDALNLAIKGLIDPAKKNHAVCVALDHNSILRPLHAMRDAGLTELTVVPVDPITGIVDPADIIAAIRPNTRLVALTHVSNVSGTIQPLREVGKICRNMAVPFVVDAAQSIGHLPIDVAADCIDLLAAPGHKGLLGPLGTGFLYLRPGMEKIVRRLKEGGTGSQSELATHPDTMPDRYESGSHNAPGILALSEGVKWVLDQTVEKLHEAELHLVRTFIEGVMTIGGLRYVGPQSVKDRIGVFSVIVEGYSPHELAAVLESGFGILSRPGLHCAPFAHETFGTIARGGTTRLSFGPFVSPQDVKYATDALAEIASSTNRLQQPAKVR